ncbi:hypothetical protein PF001_g30311 [Phytophthora fragariae]|uniref:Uncharacterized protein n=1 Tax=Phytophthora fragariae TaxID=53985 RepID=A0A6A4B5U7_9STRA|nr:hypothetical protein PF001_g30311 [Phytophthora fragariae]
MNSRPSNTPKRSLLLRWNGIIGGIPCERRYCGTQRCLSAAVVARDSSCELVRPMSLLYHKRRVTQLVRLNWYFAVGIAIRR